MGRMQCYCFCCYIPSPSANEVSLMIMTIMAAMATVMQALRNNLGEIPGVVVLMKRERESAGARR